MAWKKPIPMSRTRIVRSKYLAVGASQDLSNAVGPSKMPRYRADCATMHPCAPPPIFSASHV
eukprot:10127058-Karenia_brevis.AAC.1